MPTQICVYRTLSARIVVFSFCLSVSGCADTTADPSSENGKNASGLPNKRQSATSTDTGDESAMQARQFRIPNSSSRERARYVLGFFRTIGEHNMSTLQDLASVRGINELLRTSIVTNGASLQMLNSLDFKDANRSVIVIQPDFLLMYQSAVYVVMDGRLNRDDLMEACVGDFKGTLPNIHRVLVSDLEHDRIR